MEAALERELSDDELEQAAGEIYGGIGVSAGYALGAGIAAAGVGVLIVGFCVAAYGAHEWGWFGGWENVNDWFW